MSDSLNVIKKVLIVGGTHGNESTGVYLLRKWQQRPELLERDGLQIDTLLANPKAVTANQRYIDKDLNRCFSSAVLNDKSLQGEEINLAHKLVKQLGGKGQCQYDLIIDLHTSTASMGANLVLTRHDKFHHTMMAYMSKQRDDVVVTSEAEMIPDHHFLCALADKNLIVEIGPVAQGLLHHETIEKTEQVTYQLLDFVERWNQQNLTDIPSKLTVYEYTGKVCFPTDKNGNISATISKSIQGKDFQSVDDEAVVFNTMEDRNIVIGDIKRDREKFSYAHPDNETLFLSFINEAAYYDNQYAFCTLKKVSIPLCE